MLELKGRVIATGLGFPEGPVALADGSVLVVEIATGRLMRVTPNGEPQVEPAPEDTPSDQPA